MPSCSFAASDMRSFVQGGSHTTSTFASVTPSTLRALSRTSTGSDCAAGTCRRGQRHLHADLAVGIDEHVVDQAHLEDVHRDLGVVDGLQRLDHLRRDLVHLRRIGRDVGGRLAHFVGGAVFRQPAGRHRREVCHSVDTGASVSMGDRRLHRVPRQACALDARRKFAHAGEHRQLAEIGGRRVRGPT